jgi:hypothetical protein
MNVSGILHPNQRNEHAYEIHTSPSTIEIIVDGIEIANFVYRPPKKKGFFMSLFKKGPTSEELVELAREKWEEEAKKEKQKRIDKKIEEYHSAVNPWVEFKGKLNDDIDKMQDELVDYLTGAQHLGRPLKHYLYKFFKYQFGEDFSLDRSLESYLKNADVINKSSQQCEYYNNRRWLHSFFSKYDNPLLVETSFQPIPILSNEDRDAYVAIRVLSYLDKDEFNFNTDIGQRVAKVMALPKGNDE